MIIEYKLDAGPHGMTIPAWVKDGGHYRDPDSLLWWVGRMMHHGSLNFLKQ